MVLIKSVGNVLHEEIFDDPRRSISMLKSTKPLSPIVAGDFLICETSLHLINKTKSFLSDNFDRKYLSAADAILNI